MLSTNKMISLISTLLMLLLICGCSQSKNTNECDVDFDSNDTDINDSDIFTESENSDIDAENEFTDDDQIIEPEIISIRSGSTTNDSSPNHFTQLNETTVVFTSFTGNEGIELWRSDGTAEGTIIIKDICPGKSSSNPINLVKVGDQVYFLAASDLNRILLFRTDGTTEGTKPVTDKSGLPVQIDIIENLREDPSFTYTVTDSQMFFIIKNSDETKSLMKINNSSDSAEDLGSFPNISFIIGSIEENIFFWAKDSSAIWKLWKNSGKTNESTIIYDSKSQNEFAFLINSHLSNKKLYFTISLTDENYKRYSGDLFVTDGTTAGTKAISQTLTLNNLCSSSNRVFFNYEWNTIYSLDQSSNEITKINIGEQIWIESLAVYNDNTLLVIYSEKIDDEEFWKLGALNIETEEMTCFHTFESFHTGYVTSDTIPVILKYNDQWYMIDGEENPKYSFEDLIFYEDFLYKFDLETGKKEKINKLISSSASNFRIYPKNITVTAGKIWLSSYSFNFNGHTIGYEPLVSDATEKGTKLIKDLNKISDFTDDSFYPIYCDKHLYYNSFATYLYRRNLSSDDLESELISSFYYLYTRNFSFYNNKISVSAYYSKTSTSGEYKLISIDNDNLEIEFIKDGYNSLITPVENGFIFLNSTSKTYEKALYVSNGTESGTKILKKENDQYDSSYSFHRQFISNGKNALFFYQSGTDETLNYQIWSTDGTEENTKMLFEGIPPYLSSNHEAMLCGDKYLMSIRPGPNSISSLYYGTYISDGTADGTFEVFLCEKSENCEKVHIGCANKQPFIFIKEISPQKVIIKKITTDGKLGETVREIEGADFCEDPGNINMPELDTYLFSLYTEQNGTELWKTDGTKSGTIMVKDISEGIQGSNPEILAIHNGNVYFNASDGTNGYELWKTDGTESGTKIVADIYSGPGSSSPDEMTVTDYGIVFSGIDEDGQNKLWFIKD